MSRNRRRQNGLRSFSIDLERRELLSVALPFRPHAEIAGGAFRPGIRAERAAHGGNLFHRNGADGLVLHHAFVNRLNERVQIEGMVTKRVDEAFQVFGQNALHQSIPLPALISPSSTAVFGEQPAPSTLDGKLTLLQQQVDLALQRLEFTTMKLTPSQATSIRFSPVAGESLVPFADQQLAILADELRANPPKFDASGRLIDQTPLNQLNSAFNAISNAIAEFTVHPNLFQRPSDYYINPNVQFRLGDNAAPSIAGPDFFVRGPGGALLPGAILHPHLRYA